MQPFFARFGGQHSATYMVNYSIDRYEFQNDRQLEILIERDQTDFVKTVCILGGMSSNGPSSKYFWNEGHGWEYGGDMKHPRYGHVAVTQVSSFILYLNTGYQSVKHIVSNTDSILPNTASEISLSMEKYQESMSCILKSFRKYS